MIAPSLMQASVMQLQRAGAGASHSTLADSGIVQVFKEEY